MYNKNKDFNEVLKKTYNYQECELLKAAIEWWKLKRPSGWDEPNHLLNPTVNMVTHTETSLAKAISNCIKNLKEVKSGDKIILCEQNPHTVLNDVLTKIGGMTLFSDCAIDVTEERNLKRAGINGYNKAIQDVCKVLGEYVT